VSVIYPDVEKLRKAFREELTSGDPATKKLLIDLLRQAIREELTSGDPASKKLLTDLVLNILLKNTQIMLPVDWQGVTPETVKGSLTLLGSGARTSSSNSSDIDILHYRNLDVLIDVTAVSGTSPTLDVYIDGKFTAVGKYYPIASQTGITTTGQWLLQLRNIPYRYIRVRWVIGGTSPSFTFGVYAEASL